MGALSYPFEWTHSGRMVPIAANRHALLSRSVRSRRRDNLRLASEPSTAATSRSPSGNRRDADRGPNSSHPLKTYEYICTWNNNTSVGRFSHVIARGCQSGLYSECGGTLFCGRHGIHGRKSSRVALRGSRRDRRFALSLSEWSAVSRTWFPSACHCDGGFATSAIHDDFRPSGN